MPFCTNCGTRLQDDSRFCAGCGKGLGNGGGPATAVAPAPEPLDYTVKGDGPQMLCIRLKPGQEVYAEAGRMIYKLPEVRWECRTTEQATGEAISLTHFQAAVPAEVAFAGGEAGRIQAIDLKAGQSLLVERNALICAQGTTAFSIALIKKQGAGGQALVLEKMTGPGTVFLHAGGDFIEFNLVPGQSIQVDAACLVAFDEPAGFQIESADGIKAELLGGEGLLLATLTGPGRVALRSVALKSFGNKSLPLSVASQERAEVPVPAGAFAGND